MDHPQAAKRPAPAPEAHGAAAPKIPKVASTSSTVYDHKPLSKPLPAKKESSPSQIHESEHATSSETPDTSSSSPSSNSSMLGPIHKDEDLKGASESTTSTPSQSKRPKIRKVDGKWILPNVTREETSAARKFLKREGMMAFLNSYLPENPKGSDLLYVVLQLGFFSFKFEQNIDDEKYLESIVKILQKAMNKVLSMRTRIPEINTIDAAVEQIKKAKKILVLTGAGISTSLGIPDFRSAMGIYSRVQHLGLTDPQEVFDLATFKEEPEIFYTVAHMILPPNDSYTLLHSFIKKLDDEGKLLRNYTQNIDNLEGNVGISNDKVIQCHGSFAMATCQTCKWRIDGHKIFKYIRESELPICPHCHEDRKKRLAKDENFYPQSYGVMKPDITFFGEDLPSTFYKHIKKDVTDCDLLICVGTSLKVAPVSEIVNMIPEDVPQILINKDLVEHSEFDVSLLGYCDQVATYLCGKLGWTLSHPDFEKIRASGLITSAIDEEMGIFEIQDLEEFKKQAAKKSLNLHIDGTERL